MQKVLHEYNPLDLANKISKLVTSCYSKDVLEVITKFWTRTGNFLTAIKNKQFSEDLQTAADSSPDHNS